MATLFSTEGFMPHGHCYLWEPSLVTLHVVSDGLITVAYLTIPFLLLVFLRQRRDVPFRGIFVAFVVFIVSCGLTHAMEIWTLWTPSYWAAGGLKAITAAASVATALMLIPLVPRAIQLPSPEQLRNANQELAAANQELAAANQRYAVAMADLELQRLMVQNMSEGLLLSRADDFTIVFVNPHLERMLGYPPASLIGTRAAGLNFHPSSVESEDARTRARAAFEGGLTFENSVTLRRHDGTALWCRALSAVFEHPEHGRVIISLFREHTEVMRALMADIVQSTTEPVVAVSKSGLVQSWNAGAERLYGYPAGEAVGRSFAELTGAQIQTPEDARPIVHDATHHTRDGRELDVVVTVSPIRDHAGELVGVSKLIHDITERRLAERALAGSLADKEALLQELHHRVKNNLQVVTSLLRLQSEALTTHEGRVALSEVEGRVRAIAMLHELLYRSSNLRRVPLADYLRALLESVARAHQLPGYSVALRVDAQEVLLGVDNVVPLALILNELFTNAFKHAFAARESGAAISVDVEKDPDNLVVRVQDSGGGLPAGFELGSATGVGLQVVRSLVRQLKGQLQVVSRPGTQWTLRFPTPKEEPS